MSRVQDDLGHPSHRRAPPALAQGRAGRRSLLRYIPGEFRFTKPWRGRRASAALWFPVSLPLAPSGYRRQGQVLPFKADFPRLGCAESCLGRSLGHSLLIKMCAQSDVEGEPSPSPHPFVPCLLSLVSMAEGRAKGRGVGSSVEQCARSWLGRTKPPLVPEVPGPKQKALVPLIQP